MNKHYWGALGAIVSRFEQHRRAPPPYQLRIRTELHPLCR